MPLPSSSFSQLAPVAQGMGVILYKSLIDGEVTMYVHTNPKEDIFLCLIKILVLFSKFLICEIGFAPSLNPINPNKFPDCRVPVMFEEELPASSSLVTGWLSKSAISFPWATLNCFSINRRV